MSEASFSIYRLPVGFRAMTGAPRDGRMLILVVPLSGDHAIDDNTSGYGLTVGHNNFDNDGEDVWQYVGWCWEHDHYMHISVQNGVSTPPVNPGPIAYTDMPLLRDEDGETVNHRQREAIKRATNSMLRAKLDAKIIELHTADDNLIMQCKTTDLEEFATAAFKHMVQQYKGFLPESDPEGDQVAKELYYWMMGTAGYADIVMAHIENFARDRVDWMYDETNRMKEAVVGSWYAFGDDVHLPFAPDCVVFTPRVYETTMEEVPTERQIKLMTVTFLRNAFEARLPHVFPQLLDFADTAEGMTRGLAYAIELDMSERYAPEDSSALFLEMRLAGLSVDMDIEKIRAMQRSASAAIMGLGSDIFEHNAHERVIWDWSI